uniref:Uncharacterized protein n=1 Tax=Meloidogyne floridensis TaxID=298350 RepID=A0A915NK69_9BILA
MANVSWQKLRISMSENERANDSQILEKFLQETDYIKVMYDLKRYLRKLRNSRHELESSIPKIKPQFDNSHLLPELPPLHPSQNENTQASLKLVYTNYSDNSYRNRTFSNFCLYPNLSITEQSDEQLVNNPTPSIKSSTKEMNKLDPLLIPPGFPPLEEINVEKNHNNLNSQNNENLILGKRITNEIINQRPISPPPGFTPLDEVCIIKNICNEFTPLQETLNEDNEVRAYNYSKEMPLVLTNNPIPDLSPECPLISFENLQQYTSSFTFNSSSETTNNYSAETTIKSSKEILKVKKIINNNSNCVERLLKMSRKKALLKKSRKPQKNLSNPLPIPERSFRECKMAPQNEIIHYTPSSRDAHFNEINRIPTSQLQIRLL